MNNTNAITLVAIALYPLLGFRFYTSFEALGPVNQL